MSTEDTILFQKIIYLNYKNKYVNYLYLMNNGRETVEIHKHLEANNDNIWKQKHATFREE